MTILDLRLVDNSFSTWFPPVLEPESLFSLFATDLGWVGLFAHKGARTLSYVSLYAQYKIYPYALFPSSRRTRTTTSRLPAFVFSTMPSAMATLRVL
jgi:hypothetical protein